MTRETFVDWGEIMKKQLLGLTLLFSQFTFAESISAPKVIYGQDNRLELFQISNKKIRAIAQSTAALVKNTDLTLVNNLFEIKTETFESSMNVCSQERFAKQPNPAFCSGFLIAPNKLVTAGHCITSEVDCSETQFVFEFSMLNTTIAKTTFNQSQVYSCKKILGRTLESDGTDFAIVELDRPAEGRLPLKLSDNRSLKANDLLFVIGHPSGLPMKITDNGRVRSVNRELGFFVANTDTYGGNSGSAVFNARNYQIEGILVRGETDFTSDPILGCRVSYRVGNNEGRGEDITLISKIIENALPVQ